MIIKLILIVFILLLFALFLGNRKTTQARAGAKLAALLFIIIAITVVLFPNTSNDVAQFLGVGRGADLILYMLVVAFLFSTLNLYSRLKDEQERLTKIARKVALLETAQKKQDR